MIDYMGGGSWVINSQPKGPGFDAHIPIPGVIMINDYVVLFSGVYILSIHFDCYLYLVVVGKCLNAFFSILFVCCQFSCNGVTQMYFNGGNEEQAQ
jgi:hypothetical protein